MDELAPSSAADPDQAWNDLRLHIDWTRGRGTVVFLGFGSRAASEAMRSRTHLMADRSGIQWAEVPSEQGVGDWLAAKLPLPGLLWLELWDKPTRITVLHRLNELRVRLADAGAGCLIVCGPESLLLEAPKEAIDLWSIRSLSCVVRQPVAESLPVSALEGEGLGGLGSSQGGVSQGVSWSVTLPEEMRTKENADVLRETERVRRVVRTDPAAGAKMLAASERAGSDIWQVLSGLVRAEAYGRQDDSISASVALEEALERVGGLPVGLAQQVYEAAYEIGTAYGANEAAMRAGQEQVRIYRDHVDAVGTSQARRDLSVSLGRVGGVALGRGDLEGAVGAFEEALAIRRALAEELGTARAQRDLEAALGDMERVAQARG